MTGEIADGWLGTSFMPEHARVFFDSIEAGAKKAGRRWRSSTCRPAVTWRSATTSSACSPRASRGWRSRSARWARASTTSTTTRSGARATTDAAVEVQRLWLDGKRDEAAARVPDEIAIKTNLLGTEAMVRERVAIYRRSGITTLRVDPGGGSLEARLATLGRLMEIVKAG